jgi:hypothetical protein
MPAVAAAAVAQRHKASSSPERIFPRTESNEVRSKDYNILASPNLSAIPPKSMRIFEGPMERKAISGASGAAKWHGRYATLTDFHLGFAKQLDMKTTEAMLWMHTKELPTSVSHLEEIFKRVDADGNGTLDLEETKGCLIELNLYSNDRDVQILFDVLDMDGDGTLRLEEFLELIKKAHAVNHVVDYIPLVEIIEIRAEIHKKGRVVLNGDDDVELERLGRNAAVIAVSNNSLHNGVNADSLMPSNTVAAKTVNRKTSFLEVCVNHLEKATGLETAVVVRVPKHDPSVSDVHIVITTIEGGHNAGKTYIHRVPESDAQAWLEALTSAVNQAKAAALKQELELKYGHSKYSMARAKSQIVYQSEGFQMLTAFFIICAFALDICEAQLLPVQGSPTGFIFFILDAILTGLFTLELMLNIFAHSNNWFEPFYSRGSNMFDFAIVSISVYNVTI